MELSYRARTWEGKEVSGAREARDPSELARLLREEGLVLTSVQSPLSAGRAASLPALLQKWNEALIRISLHEKILFLRNLGIMTAAGLSISRALNTLERQTNNRKLKRTISALAVSIQKGENLSRSLAAYPELFSSVTVAMVAAGEESGKLSEALEIVAAQMEKHYLLLKKVRGALVYPAIVLTAMVGIGIFMLVYIVPTITKTFVDLHVELPASTQFLIWTSNFLLGNALLAAALALACAFLLVRLMKTARGARARDALFLRLPLLSPIVKHVNAATTARTLSSLLASGVDMVEALSITNQVLANSFYRAVMDEARAAVQKGVPLSKIFRAHERLYPVLVAAMTEVGEETGKTSDMLAQVASFYEQEVDDTTKNLSTIIEPLLMIVVGGAVGFFAMSMIGPIYSLSQGI